MGVLAWLTGSAWARWEMLGVGWAGQNMALLEENRTASA